MKPIVVQRRVVDILAHIEAHANGVHDKIDASKPFLCRFKKLRQVGVTRGICPDDLTFGGLG